MKIKKGKSTKKCGIEKNFQEALNFKIIKSVSKHFKLKPK